MNKQKTFTITLYCISAVFASYSIALNIISPGTFWDIVTSFSNIWLFAGIILFSIATYRLKTGKNFRNLFSKKWKLIIGSLLSVIGAICIVNLIFILRPKNSKIPDQIDYVILLGGGIDKNGEIAPNVQNRIDRAALVLKSHPESRCVVTGGTLKWLPFPEAPEMKRQLEKRGIESQRVYVEANALDTIQNFQKSLELICENEKIRPEDVLQSRIVVVTNKFHMNRSLRLANRMGFKNIYSAPAPTKVFHIPMAYLREICSYVKLNARILLTGKPEPII